MTHLICIFPHPTPHTPQPLRQFCYGNLAAHQLIRQAGFWTTLIGESESNQLTYMLAWDSMAEREERWSAFLADPEWIAIRTETEKDGSIVQNIRNELLAPTAFSSVR